MATDSTNSFVNGVSANSSVSRGQHANPAAPSSTQPDNHSPEEVGWYFVESYYNTMSKHPDRLYLFFKERSQFTAGLEEEKVNVYVGQKSIGDRIKELDFQDCKVRVTNVDTQKSGNHIVVQVIGEISNKSAPSRKFAQTFVLAPQTNGWYVLNDIFRYLSDEEEEPIQETGDVAPATEFQAAIPASELEAPASVKELPSESVEAVDIKKVDQQLEDAAKTATVEDTNGHSDAVEVPAAVDDAPAAAAAAGAEAEKSPAQAEKIAPESISQSETPHEPAPTPAAVEPKSVQKVAAVPQPPKPIVPKTWAQLASANSAAASQAANLAPPTTSTASAAPITKSSPSAAPSAPAATTPVAAASPQRQPSPADSNQDGSSGGWQTAGADHSRNKSRSHTGPTISENGTVRAYVKNVFQSVSADALKAELSKYGELSYFDVSRQKNSAFVEFKTVQGFENAVAANPHRLAEHDVIVEERRPSGFPARGNLRGGASGRPNVDNRPNSGRGAFRGDGPARGGSFANRGRGGAGNVPNRSRPQAV